MAIKIYPKDLIVWRAYLLDSKARFWNPYNFSHLYNFSSKHVILDAVLVAKQLEIALNLLASVFKKGGKSWFYNVLRHEKRFIVNLNMQYVEVKRSRKLSFGLSLGSWYPGRLSNRKFLRLRSRIIRKRLFLHKLSAFKRFSRLYKPGGRRLSGVKRRRRFSTPPWARLERNWRPKSRARRKGFSSKYLILYFQGLFRRKYKKRLKKVRRYNKFRKYKFTKKIKKLRKRLVKRAKLKNKVRSRRVGRTWIYFFDMFGSFFKKPDFTRSFNIYVNFAPTPIPYFELDKLTPGTADNPTDLPITSMPTTHVRRKIRKKKKIYKLLYNPFDTKSGEDFSSLTDTFKLDIKLKKSDLLEADLLRYPTNRFYSFLIYRPYRHKISKSIKKHFNKYEYRSFKNRFTYRSLKRYFKLKKRYVKAYKSQVNIYKWFSKLLKLTDKVYRLSFGVLALSFRSFFTDLAQISYLIPFSKGRLLGYKKKTIKFFTNFSKVTKNSLVTFLGAVKPFKKFKFLSSRLFIKRIKRKRLFRRRKLKPKIGSVTPHEKLFKTLTNKTFKRIEHFRNTFRRRALLDVLFNKYRSNNLLNFVRFNFNPKLVYRKKRIFSNTYLDLKKKSYTIKRKPIFSIFFNSKNGRANSLRFLTSLTKFKHNRALKTKQFLKRNKFLARIKTFYDSVYPKFIKERLFIKSVKVSKLIRSLNKGLKLESAPFRYYPTTMFTARLSRLTISIFNEARASGVILLYLNSGEVSPKFNYYNVVISDREKFLLKLELIFKNIYAISRISGLLNKNPARYIVL